MFSQDFLYFISALQNAETIPEVHECWNMISSQYPNTKIVIGVEDETYVSIPQGLKINPYDNFEKKAYQKKLLFYEFSLLLE